MSPRPETSTDDEVFDLITRLVDKSLVVAEEDAGGQPRYRLLETLRAYAIAQAHTAGELAVPPRCSRDVVDRLARTSLDDAQRRDAGGG